MAPDAASFKAGRGLAAARKWEGLGGDGEAIWGLASGSGKKPYQCQVALDELATKCSCPSRKFPCKHALGLMFLAAEDPGVFAAGSGTRPEWVAEWIETRQQRRDRAAEKAGGKDAPAPKDAAASARRREKRAARIDDGVAQLEQVLLDLVRHGLSRDEVSQPAFWDDLARRLVDAQAPGLAGRVRGLGELPHSGDGWEGYLLRELGSLWALLVAYRRHDGLESDLGSEVRQLLGWAPDKDEVLQGPGVADRWFVAARSETERDRLVTSSTWLYGCESKRWALVLRFAPLPSRPAEPWPLGGEVEAELVFYPGAAPDRALPRDESATAKIAGTIPDAPGGFRAVLDSHATNLAANPWRGRQPFLVAAQPARHAGRPVLVDADGDALPWSPSEGEEDLLTSISGGHPIPLCGEWNGRHLAAHAASDAGSWISLHTASL